MFCSIIFIYLSMHDEGMLRAILHQQTYPTATPGGVWGAKPPRLASNRWGSCQNPILKLTPMSKQEKDPQIEMFIIQSVDLLI